MLDLLRRHLSHFESQVQPAVAAIEASADGNGSARAHAANQLARIDQALLVLTGSLESCVANTTFRCDDSHYGGVSPLVAAAATVAAGCRTQLTSIHRRLQPPVDLFVHPRRAASHSNRAVEPVSGAPPAAAPDAAAFTATPCDDITVSLDDLVGADAAVGALTAAFVRPYESEDPAQQQVGRLSSTNPAMLFGCKPSRSALLYGPPGTGKTLVAAALAKRLQATLVSASASELLSKWFGESERLVRKLFEFSRAFDRCVVFLDEVDALCSCRGGTGESEVSRRVKTEFLLAMNDLERLEGSSHSPTVFVVLAATNVPWEIDPAMRRRFDEVIFMGLPDAAARRRLLEAAIADVASRCGVDGSAPPEAVRLSAVAKETFEGFSAADIRRCVDRGRRMAAQRWSPAGGLSANGERSALAWLLDCIEECASTQATRTVPAGGEAAFIQWQRPNPAAR